ncbi:MAG: hypothetical protein Tsb0034_23830 [Ekhidna sp.]
MLVYGPKTTKYITEQEILNRSGEYKTLDTTIYHFERQSLVDRHARRYQNLGVFGTASFPVFYDPSTVIGRSSGYNAYTPYAFDPTTSRYYDTKSSFLDVFAYLGGGNRNIVNVAFSRNVNENWNLGFDYRKITADKQLARNGPGDRQVVGSAFMGYTHYKHPSKNYQVLFNYSLLNHDAIELGGALYRTSDSLRSNLFEFDNALLRLDEAQSNIKQRRLHLYHEYQVAEQFQLYHTMDYETEDNVFKDFADASIGDYNPYFDFYPNFFLDQDSTYQQATFSSFKNEAGLKGDLTSVFYRAYLKVRSVDFRYNYLDPTGQVLEKYIGGYARFRWKDKFSVEGNGEYMVGGEYSLQGSLSSKLLNATYLTQRKFVPFIYSSYFGNHHEWSNSFDPVFTNKLTGDIRVDYKFITLKPKVELTTYQNFLYFDQERQPQQNTSALLLSSLGGDVNFRFLNAKGEGWHLENELLYSEVTGDGSSAIRVPRLFYNGRLFWRGNWFKDRVPIEVGVDTHARSAYFANNFAPETQQFYLQDEFQLDGYYMADLFINMRLDKFYFSLKWTHVDQPTDGGYFASPYYPGQPRTIDLIIKWMFFD